MVNKTDFLISLLGVHNESLTQINRQRKKNICELKIITETLKNKFLIKK